MPRQDSTEDLSLPVTLSGGPGHVLSETKHAGLSPAAGGGEEVEKVYCLWRCQRGDTARLHLVASDVGR